MEFIKELYVEFSTNPIVKATFLWIMFDTIFGVLRSVKTHKFNSCFGIDGGIRKVGMIVSIMFLGLADQIVHINLAFLIPTEVLNQIGLEKVGTLEFFGILFVLYETISILKNLYILGLPMPIWLKTFLENLLNNLTNEMPAGLADIKPGTAVTENTEETTKSDI